MQSSIKKIIVVLNDFMMLDTILEKTFYFAKRYHSIVEILYVHESPFFDIPNFFHSGEKNTLDKEKIKLSILEKVHTFTIEKEPVVFVKIDDTANRVWALSHEDKDTLIITTYQKKITHKLISKITHPTLIVKNTTQEYRKIALIINTESPSSQCIEMMQTHFPQSHITLFYDYHYIIDPEMETSLQNIQMIENAQREAFKQLKQESALEGKFFIDNNFLGTELNTYLQEKKYDMVYICSPKDDWFVSDTLTMAFLDTLTYDILISSR